MHWKKKNFHQKKIFFGEKKKNVRKIFFENSFGIRLLCSLQISNQIEESVHASLDTPGCYGSAEG